LDAGGAAAQVCVGIETDRGLWVQALVAAGYRVYPINPVQVARYRQRLREFFPSALEVFNDLDAPEALELLAAAPDPQRAAALTTARIAGALRRANRRDVALRATRMRQQLRTPALHQPVPVQAAYAAIVTTQVRLLTALVGEIDRLTDTLTELSAKYPDADRYLSHPASVSSWPPGCSASSATTRPDSSTPRPARTTPAAPRSPVPPAAAASCWPATPATATSLTRSTNGHSARCADHLAPARTTPPCAHVARATRPRYVNSPTDGSVSCTAA